MACPTGVPLILGFLKMITVTGAEFDRWGGAAEPLMRHGCNIPVLQGGVRNPRPEKLLHTLHGFGAPGSHCKGRRKKSQNRNNDWPSLCKLFLAIPEKRRR
jgi:hypothetical protein